MVTESKADEEKQLTATEDGSDDTSQLALIDQMMEQLSSLINNLLPNEEEHEGPPVFNSFDLASAAEYMAKCSNILVMSGAGISTSAGIPDFRSPDTGIYSQLEKYNLPNPETIFQLDFFRLCTFEFNSSVAFFMITTMCSCLLLLGKSQTVFLLAKELYPKTFLPTSTHYFIRLLSEKGKLLRTFTQNIDSLERIAGIPAEKIVEAHGTFFTAHCLDCRKEYSLEYMQGIIFRDEIPYCDTYKGIIKPDIVFFGESLPQRFTEYVQSDFSKCDFLIIIGTSLAVAPFNNLISYVDKNCPRLLINREPVGNTASFWMPFETTLMFDSPKNRRDIFHKSTCDEGVTDLAKLLGWENDFKKLLEKERKSSLTTSSTPLDVADMSTRRTSSVSKLANETARRRRRSISPMKATNATTRNRSPKKTAAAASVKTSPKFTSAKQTSTLSKSETEKNLKKSLKHS